MEGMPSAYAAYADPYGYHQPQGYPSAMPYVDPSGGYYYHQGVPGVMMPGVPPVSGIPLPPGSQEEEEVSEERKQRRKERKEAKDRKNKIELSGNPDTMNLSELILNNILGSTYFKGLLYGSPSFFVFPPFFPCSRAAGLTCDRQQTEDVPRDR